MFGDVYFPLDAGMFSKTSRTVEMFIYAYCLGCKEHPRLKSEGCRARVRNPKGLLTSQSVEGLFFLKEP